MKLFLSFFTLILTSMVLFTSISRASFALETHDGGIRECHEFFSDKKGVEVSYRTDDIKCATQYLLRADDGGIRNCYMADQYGTTYGAKVKTSKCLIKFLGFALETHDGGIRECHEFFSDKKGVEVSYRTDDIKCATQYLLRADDGGIRNCYMADQYGTTYGANVKISNCIAK